MFFITYLRHSHRRVSYNILRSWYSWRKSHYILSGWHSRFLSRTCYGFCSWNCPSSTTNFVNINGVSWTTTWHIWITNTGDIAIRFILPGFICWKIIATSTLIAPYKAIVCVARAMFKTPEISTMSQVKMRVCNCLTHLGSVSQSTDFQTTWYLCPKAWCCIHGGNSRDSSVPKQQQLM